MSAITLHEPNSFTVSPALARVSTRWDVLAKLDGERDHKDTLEELRAEWAAFVADIREHGVREPIKFAVIDGVKTLLSGRHRCAAAIECGVKVPAEEVPASEATATIESSMMLCNGYSKGQRAYVAIVLHPEVATEGDKREKAGKAQPSALNAEGLAAKFGVSVRLIEQAAQLYRLLTNSATKRKAHEWRVFAGHGLGAILAGLAGAESTAGKNRPAVRERTVVECLAPTFGFFTRYSQLKGEAKDAAFDDAVDLLAARQDFEAVEFIAELVNAAIARRSETANGDEEGES